MKLIALRATLTILSLALFCAGVQAAEPNFPALTGRVVDGANLLSPDARQRIDRKLADYEAKTSDQVVVATVPGLQDYPIEDFSNRLFRFWKLGQAKTNNGVLLLVAPTERKARIEVGYGLEGSLTDALTRVIISGAMAPKFKANDFAGGIETGVDAIIATLSGDDEWRSRAALRPVQKSADDIDPMTLILIIVIFVVVFYLITRANRNGTQSHYTRNGNWVVIPSSSSSSSSSSNWGSSWSSGSSSGSSGGFSGGGGSSGGGGASGDW